MLDNRIEIAAQDVLDLLDFGLVTGFVFQCLTRALAVFDVVFQAYLVLASGNVFGRQIELAGAQWKQLAQQFPNDLGTEFRGIRAKIYRTIANDAPRKKHPGERLFFDADVGIRPVIFEHHVVARLIFFDQGTFQ